VSERTRARAIANALWRSLAEDGWQLHRVTRDLDDLGDRPATGGGRGGSASLVHPSRALSRVEVHRVWFVRAVVKGGDADCLCDLAVELTQPRFVAAAGGAAVEVLTALSAKVVRAPFLWSADVRGYRRNTYGGVVTPAVAAALESVALAADVVELPEGWDDEAVGVSLSSVLEAVARADEEG
jgi:hypothetical protein